jgi:Fur family ferric uptake transcriptional regulator
MVVDRSVEALNEACRSRGIRLTGQRKAISEVMARAQDHPSATDIHELVTRKHPRISLATVYRTLSVLRDAGIVEEHRFGEGRCHYELADGPHHDHLIDAETGQIVEFTDPEIERLQHAIAERLGYRLTGHKLELYGVRAGDADQG